MVRPPKNHCVALGEVLWDLFPDSDRFGGASANFACHAALQGTRATILSSIGADPRGDAALDIMKRIGVDISYVQRDPTAPTGTVGVTLDQAGKPTFVIHPNSAWDQLQWQPEFESLIANADAIYFGTLGQRESTARETISRALQVAKDENVLRVLDVNLRAPFFNSPLIRHSISMASVVKLSDDEFRPVMAACDIRSTSGNENALRALLHQFGLDLVVMTRGPAGALVVSRDETIDQPGTVVEVCDTVGAGDAFTAALVTGLFQYPDLRSITANACRAAAAACTYAGAIPPRSTISP